MKLWLVVGRDAYNEIVTSGQLTPPLPEEFEEETHIWLKDQMSKRIPSYQNTGVIFAHTEPFEQDSLSEHYFPGEYILLEIEKPDHEVVVFTAGALFNCVGSQYVPIDEADYQEHNLEQAKAYATGHLTVQDIRDCVESGDLNILSIPEEEQKMRDVLDAKVEASWERIFDTESLSDYWGGRRMAAFETLSLDDILLPTMFIGTYKDQFYGPNHIGRDDMPPITGFGDDLYIRDKFQYQDAKTGELSGVYTLCGYEHRNGLYHVDTIKEGEGYSSFCIGRNAHFDRSVKVLI